MRGMGLAAGLCAALIAFSPARACLPPLLESRLADESDADYAARTEALRHEREAARLKERQTMALSISEAIFIARDTDWAPIRRQPLRNGRPPPMATISYAPSYFKPVAWFRGPRTTALFQLRVTMTDCGLMGTGDTASSQPGDLYVFFAHKGPLSRKALIDAIAVDRISDPALMEFVAKYRRKPAAPPALSPQ